MNCVKRKTEFMAIAMVTATILAFGGSTASASTFKAIGTGTVILRSDTSTTFFLHGNGTLVVHDRTQVSISDSGSGTKQIQGNKMVYKNYTGSVTVKGNKIRCRFFGGDVRLRTLGKGTCYLNGQGKFWVDGYGPTPWGEPKTVAYGQED